MPSLTARENVEIALNIAGVHGGAAHERAHQLLDRLGLIERIGFLPEQLSGGEKQRVAIARALANEPALILADEPTANLDSHHGREVMRELRRIAKDEGRSVVIVSHDQRLKDIADRVLWLEDGRFSRDDELVIDPVCGMSLERADARNSLEADGETYWFCCQGCQNEFAQELAARDAHRARRTPCAIRSVTPSSRACTRASARVPMHVASPSTAASCSPASRAAWSSSAPATASTSPTTRPP